MKRMIPFCVTLFLLVCAQSASAKIWRVNNNPGVAADFTTLQAAHDGATAGDTLHLEASPNSYGGLTCIKKLVILGTGYFLDENAGSQALAQAAKVDAVSFNNGSAGSVIMGFDLQSNAIHVNSPDIVIRRNKLTAYHNSTHDGYTGAINVNHGVSNIIISQNYGVQINVSAASTGILVTNNYIANNGHNGDASTGTALYLHPNAIALVQNNIFRRGKVTANNSSFSNNIMYAGQFVGTGNLVSNNVANAEQFGTTNGNQANVDMSTVFVGPGTGVSTDGQWKLKVGSPALGAGYGSTTQTPIDCGMFSGNSPYVLAGLPSMPAIYFFENQPVGSNTDPIDVTIKVKSAGN